MELDHEFTVPVPVDQAWQVLLDVERIAPCMPGATLDAAGADEFTGRLKVRLGAMTVTYRGTARIASRDEEARAVTIEASGKEARGPGTASATVQAQLHEEDGRTRVTVHTKLNVTGRPAQFGRGILAEVGGRLIGRFADNLAAELASEPEGDTPAQTGPGTEGAVEAPAEARIEADASSAATAEKAVTAQATTGTPTAAGGDTGTPAEGGAGTGVPSEPAAEEHRTAPPSPTEPAAAEHPTAEPAHAEPAAAPAARTPAQRPEAEPIDLLEVAGPAVLKRAAPVAAALVLLWTVWRIVRRRR